MTPSPRAQKKPHLAEWEMPDAPALRAMLRDVRKDIQSTETQLAELRLTETWIQSHLEVRRSVTLEQVRDWFQEYTDIQNPAAIEEVAAGLQCSPAQLRSKNYIESLIATGTIILVKSDLDRRIRYRFDAPDHRALKTFKRRPAATYRGNAAAVPGVSTRRVQARRVLIKKARRGH